MKSAKSANKSKFSGNFPQFSSIFDVFLSKNLPNIVFRKISLRTFEEFGEIFAIFDFGDRFYDLRHKVLYKHRKKNMQNGKQQLGDLERSS